MIAYLRYEFERSHYKHWLTALPQDHPILSEPLAAFLGSLVAEFFDVHYDFIVSDGQAFAWLDQRTLIALPEWIQPLVIVIATTTWQEEFGSETPGMALAKLDEYCPEVPE